MIHLSPLARFGIVLVAAASCGALHAQAPAAPALIGQWNFETAVGTTSNNGVVTDDMGKGIFTITQTRKGLAGTILSSVGRAVDL